MDPLIQDELDERFIKEIYTCPFEDCNVAYFDLVSLETYIATEHYADMPYKCQFKKCSVAFTQEDRLKKHKEKYSKDKRFKCKVNGYSYSNNRRDNLIFHVISVHTGGKAV